MRCDYIGWLPVCTYLLQHATLMSRYRCSKYTKHMYSRYFNPISYHEMTLGLSIKPCVQHFFKTTYPVEKHIT